MALPQQVLEQLSREPPKTPGWSFGLLMFSAGLLFITLLVYFGLTLGYEPYLNGQISHLNAQIDAESKSISPADETHLITLYSEIANLKNILGSHVEFSQFLSWLEKNTEANVTYSQLSLSNGNQISLTGSAAAEADVNQQIAIFEAAPEVKTVSLSNVTLSAPTGQWQFNVTLVMNSLQSTTP